MQVYVRAGSNIASIYMFDPAVLQLSDDHISREYVDSDEIALMKRTGQMLHFSLHADGEFGFLFLVDESIPDKLLRSKSDWDLAVHLENGLLEVKSSQLAVVGAEEVPKIMRQFRAGESITPRMGQVIALSDGYYRIVALGCDWETADGSDAMLEYVKQHADSHDYKWYEITGPLTGLLLFSTYPGLFAILPFLWFLKDIFDISAPLLMYYLVYVCVAFQFGLLFYHYAPFMRRVEKIREEAHIVFPENIVHLTSIEVFDPNEEFEAGFFGSK